MVSPSLHTPMTSFEDLRASVRMNRRPAKNQTRWLCPSPARQFPKRALKVEPCIHIEVSGAPHPFARTNARAAWRLESLPADAEPTVSAKTRPINATASGLHMHLAHTGLTSLGRGKPRSYAAPRRVSRRPFIDAAASEQR